MSFASRLGCAAVATALAVAGACGERDELPSKALVHIPRDAGEDGFDAGNHTGPPGLDAAGLCGNQIHKAVTNAPNVYFVLDSSGSMSAPAPNASSRYEAVRIAVVDLARKLGPLINVGAARFPINASDQNPCHVGGEVMPITPGTPKDPQTGKDGATTFQLAQATSATPFGGTPTGKTLAALLPELSELTGKTIVLLATDGGPNCNPLASCSAAECMFNIEGDPNCGAVNCCSTSGPYGADGPLSCIDHDPTVDAVAALADAGIDVYVIGIPGSEIYSDVLDDMALAGGVALATSPNYYRVDDLDQLQSVLGAIASVVVSCEFDLVDAPPDPGMTNVYIDGVILPSSYANGWTWKSETVIQFNGEACVRLKNGQIGQVQIVSGCPTEIAK